MKASIITLTDDELTRYRALRPQEGAAFRFWKDATAQRKMNLSGTKNTVVSIEKWGDRDFRVSYSPRKITKRRGE